jgi:hypothetical protein
VLAWVVALFAAIFVLLAAPASHAGLPVRDGAGNFAVFQLKISPPRADRGRPPRPITVDFHNFTGNDLTGHPPWVLPQDLPREIRTEEWDFPRGMKINYRAYPACTYSRLLRLGPPGCPRRSQIGAGATVLDVRPLVPTFFSATLRLFNGKGPDASPAVLVWAKDSFGTSATLPASITRPRKGFGPAFVLFRGPTPPQGVVAGFAEANIRFSAAPVRFHGVRVPFLEAPPSCAGTWLSQDVATHYDGTKLVATDRQPCV